MINHVKRLNNAFYIFKMTYKSIDCVVQIKAARKERISNYSVQEEEEEEEKKL